MSDTAVEPDLVPAVVSELVRLVAPLTPSEVTGDQRLIQDLGFHSLALAELGFNLEDLFSLNAIAPEMVMRLSTVKDVVTLIEETLAEGKARLPVVADVEAVCDRYGVVWNPRG